MERTRREPKKAAALPANVLRGLASLAEGNERAIAAMLDYQPANSALGGADLSAALVAKLADTMAVNSLSAEALMARFFDDAMLGAYCVSRLGKSGKGNAATLAARVAKEWARPAFEPLAAAAEGAPAPKKQKVASAAPLASAAAAPPSAPPAAKAPAAVPKKAAAAAAQSIDTLAGVLAKHGFGKAMPACKCFRAFARGATGAKLRTIDAMLGTPCGLVEASPGDTGMLECDREAEAMPLAQFMRWSLTEAGEQHGTTYFSWCDKAFYTTEFGYQHRGGGCGKYNWE